MHKLQQTEDSSGVYRNITPATPAPNIQPAGRRGNINSVDQLRHPRSVAYSVELQVVELIYTVNVPHWPAGCILGAGVAGVVFLYTALVHLQW